jgi:hypothetical protein
MSEQVTKFVVFAVRLDRKTREHVCGNRRCIPFGCSPRRELIDTATNPVFEGLFTPLEIEQRYESFWNDTNPRSREIVKVVEVLAVFKQRRQRNEVAS